LESTIEALEHDLEESRKEADDAIAEWQGSYDLLQGRNGELEAQVATLTAELQTLKAAKQSMDDELVRYMTLEAEARGEVSKLHASLEAARAEESNNGKSASAVSASGLFVYLTLFMSTFSRWVASRN
jgi:chromosome segregation ATPase